MNVTVSIYFRHIGIIVNANKERVGKKARINVIENTINTIRF